MRILIVQESDWLIRGPHDQHHLAEKLSLRGHEIRVIDFEVQWLTHNGKELFSRRRVYNNVCKLYDAAQITVIRPGIIKIRIPGLDYLSLIFSHGKEIRRQIRDFKPDVIIGMGILNAYLAMRAARGNNIPYIYYWLDVLHALIPFKYFRSLAKAIEKIVLRQADAVIVTNKRLRNLTIDFGARPEQTHIFRHGVNFDKFNSEGVDGTIVRRQLGIKPDDIVITYVGRLSRITGVRQVALGLSKIDNPHLKFLVVGTGSREAELRQMQQDLGMQDRLIITGRSPYDEIPGLLAASDICLLSFHRTSLTEDIVPMKVTDYMAMGKPVISSRLPGMVEEFGEDNGVCFVDNPEDMPIIALELFAQGRLVDLGAKGKRNIQGNSWDKLADDFQAILTDCISKKRGESITVRKQLEGFFPKKSPTKQAK